MFVRSEFLNYSFSTKLKTYTSKCMWIFNTQKNCKTCWRAFFFRVNCFSSGEILCKLWNWGGFSWIFEWWVMGRTDFNRLLSSNSRFQLIFRPSLSWNQRFHLFTSTLCVYLRGSNSKPIPKPFKVTFTTNQKPNYHLVLYTNLYIAKSMTPLILNSITAHKKVTINK